MKSIAKKILAVFLAVMMVLPSAYVLDNIGVTQAITAQAATKKTAKNAKKTSKKSTKKAKKTSKKSTKKSKKSTKKSSKKTTKKSTKKSKKKAKFTAPKNLKLKVKASNSFDVSFSKVNGANGYVIYYSTSKKFTKKTTKKVKVKVTKKNKKKKTITKRIKKLKNKKKYYVRVKAYKTVKKKTTYTKYSSVKSIKTKKVKASTPTTTTTTTTTTPVEATTSVPTTDAPTKTQPANQPADLKMETPTNVTVVNGSIPENDADKPVSYTEDNSTNFTREEWLKALAEKAGFANSTVDHSAGYSFSDSEDCENAELVEYALQTKILPESASLDYDAENDVPTFEPNGIATREFAAYTAVAAMGYDLSQDKALNCGDASQVTYKTAVCIAIENDFLSLDSTGNFNPTAPMTGTDKNHIIGKVENLQKSQNIDRNTIYQNVQYQSKVEGSSSISYTVTDLGNDTYTVSIPYTSGNYSVGDVVVLPANNEHIAGFPIKIQSVSVANGMYTIQAVKPEIEEVYSDLQFEGYASADVNNAQLSDGAQIEQASENGDAFNFNEEYSTAIDKKLTKKLDAQLKNGVKLKGKIELSIPEIKARVDANLGWTGFKLNDFLISATEKLYVNGNVSYSNSGSTTYELIDQTGQLIDKASASGIEIGRIPFALGTTGLSVDIVFYLTVSVNGEIDVTYTLTAMQGIQYTNNEIRTIKEITKNSIDANANASAKLGCKLSIGLWALETFNIIAFACNIGIAGDINYVAHTDCNPVLHCGDLGYYLYLDLSVDGDCLASKAIKKIKNNINLTWEIWTKKNSPFKGQMHLENGHKVDKCTYGVGTFSGRILKSNHEGISRANIKVYSGNVLVATAYTESDGSFKTLQSLGKNNYRIEVSASGYKRYTSNEKIEHEGENQLQDYIMIRKDSQGTGTLECVVLNAINGNRIPNAQFSIYNGYNNTAGNTVATGNADNDGSISNELPVGNYTIVVGADGYSKTISSFAIEDDESTFISVTLNVYDASLEGTMRIILTWGEYPSDLDSHLYGGVNGNNSSYHVYYSDKYPTNNDNSNLDVDDTTSYGPETITINGFNTGGKYQYFVHDYSNKYSSSSSALSNSGATVRVYKGNDLIATYRVPTNRNGTVWHVFDYDPVTDTFTNTFTDQNGNSINMYNQSDPEYVNIR